DIETHGDVGAEATLNLSGTLRGEPRLLPVVDGAEGHAVFVERRDRVAKREDLEAARVREDRAAPSGEAVNPAELLHHLLPRTEVQVVRVREDHVGTEGADVVGVQALHGCLRPDGHERRGTDLAVGRPEDAGAGGAVGGDESEGHSTTIASPNE